MKRKAKTIRNNNRSGVVLVISMIMLVAFVSLSSSVLTISSANAKIANNHRQSNHALANAFSGMEVMRYWLEGITVSGSAAGDSRLSIVYSNLGNSLANVGATDVSLSYDNTSKILTISNYVLDSDTNERFTATVSFGDDYDTVQVDVTGHSNSISRTVRNNFWFGAIGSSIFDFGVATKGPLFMTGNIDLEGYNEDVEASIYIESLNSCMALEMNGKSAIAGDVSIVNSLANADIGNASTIAGDKGDDAHDNITIGVDQAEFPNPNPEVFEQYIETEYVSGTTPLCNATLQNIRIPANSNPNFSGNFALEGVMYIESPNVVTFCANCDITGVIIAEGDVDSPSSDNQLIFTGNVSSKGLSELPDEDSFSALKEETGTFILAPGFSATFMGNFDTVNGVIAASGITFSGNAGGRINGSVINYSEDTMTLNGNSDLVFNRSGIEATPSGFGPSRRLQFMPGTYSEIFN